MQREKEKNKLLEETREGREGKERKGEEKRKRAREKKGKRVRGRGGEKGVNGKSEGKEQRNMQGKVDTVKERR